MTSSAQTQLALAEAARQVQMQIRARALADVTRAWRLLDANRLQATWPGWLQVMSVLLTRYHRESALSAGAHYRASRMAALRVAPPSLIRLAPPPAPQWLERSLGWAGPGRLAQGVGAPEQVSKVALTQTLGTSGRIVLAGARTTTFDTVTADPEALGYYRKTDGAPCYFCALLASRGAVYKQGSFTGQPVHDHCGCTLAPVFSRDQPLPELNRRAFEVYKSRGDGPALQAFRTAWEAHAA